MTNPYADLYHAWEQGYQEGCNTALQRARNEQDQQTAAEIYVELVDRSQVIAWLWREYNTHTEEGGDVDMLGKAAAMLETWENQGR